MDVQRIKVGSALSAVVCAILLSILFIAGIWTGFDNVFLRKCIGTLFVLFFLSLVAHTVLKGLTEKTKSKD